MTLKGVMALILRHFTDFMYDVVEKVHVHYHIS